MNMIYIYIYIYVYIYIHTWKPNDPCFEWSERAFFWRVQTNPKIEDIQIDSRYIHIHIIYLYMNIHTDVSCVVENSECNIGWAKTQRV